VVAISNPVDGGTHDIKYDDEPAKEPISEKMTWDNHEKW